MCIRDRVGSQALRCPELLFTPSLRAGHEEHKGLHQLVEQTAAATEMDVRPHLLQNVILSGGTTCFDQLPERLEAELSKITPCKVKIVAPADRSISVWIGGSVLSGLSTFEQQWITKDEYAESGPRIVHKKCAAL
eukprot:TRINITY_DN5578_c0_g1_i2.p1 TRINITY_DN5578_c0_g1~~TRINITY_DN5578_c0_g1_i2.p1  ORF type:complete len:135 (-),score=35.00 TRINITY_DN5578_c0_g1_i2:185-589(-)